MKDMEVYRLGVCYCHECEHYCKSDCWCIKWDNKTVPEGFCHWGELKEPEWADDDEDGILAKRRRAEKAREDADWQRMKL